MYMYVFVYAHVVCFGVFFLTSIFLTILPLIYKRPIHTSDTTLVLLPIHGRFLTFNTASLIRVPKYDLTCFLEFTFAICSLGLLWGNYHKVCDN